MLSNNIEIKHSKIMATLQDKEKFVGHITTIFDKSTLEESS